MQRTKVIYVRVDKDEYDRIAQIAATRSLPIGTHARNVLVDDADRVLIERHKQKQATTPPKE